MFTPGVLLASNSTEGPFLGAGGATLFVPGAIDNAVGVVSGTANTLVGPVAGVNGSGTLAQLMLTAGSAGLGTVTLTNVLLLDSSLADIPVDVTGSTITIQPIPEPGNGLLAASALACVLGRRLLRNARRLRRRS